MTDQIYKEFTEKVSEFIEEYGPALEALARGERKMITVEFKQDGQMIGLMTADPKEFKTGSKGYYSNGKITIGEKRYQVQVQLVEIGSKPKEDAGK